MINELFIFNEYKKQFDYLKTLTDKKIFIQDIIEKRIYDSFYELGFYIKYLNTFRKFKRNLFLPSNNTRKQINSYIEKLPIEKQKELIINLYEELHNYSLNRGGINTC